MAEARRVQTTYSDTETPANTNRPPLRVVQTNSETPADSTRNASIQTRSTNADRKLKQSQPLVTGQSDIATQFNASYAKQGIQPHNNLDTQAGEASPRQLYTQPEQITRSEAGQQKRGLIKKGAKTLTYRRRLKKRGMVKRGFAKARVTGINAWVWSWGLWSWGLFQLPLAILSVVFMALTETIYQLYLDLETQTNDEGLIEQVVEGAVIGTMSILEKISNLLSTALGFDLSDLNPANFFMLTYLVVLLFGWFTLMLIYFQYKIAFLHPTSGKGSSVKLGMLILAIVGYAIPILNIFPWFIFWTMSVWWYPK